MSDKKDETPKQLPLFEGMVEEPLPSDLAPVEDESEAAPLSIYSERPVFNPEDITPPVMKLLQALSPDVVEGNGKAGQWSLSGFPAKDALTIVPVSFARRREYRAEDEPILACVSFDGETGEGTPGGLCADCPMNKWTGEGKNRKGPQCVFMYSYMAYIQEYDTIALINFKRTGLSVGRSLNSIVARSGMKAVAVTLQSKLQSGGKGSYYIPQIVPVTGEVAATAISKARAMLGA